MPPSFGSMENFYPRPPRGGRRSGGVTIDGAAISIHALREEGDSTNGNVNIDGKISIHALREEGDQGQLPFDAPYLISIHALREEGDHAALRDVQEAMRFLSTPSARRATH